MFGSWVSRQGSVSHPAVEGLPVARAAGTSCTAAGMWERFFRVNSPLSSAPCIGREIGLKRRAKHSMDTTSALAQPVERRNRTLQTIATLMAERREMLVLFCRVAGLPPYRGKALDAKTMHRFCQVLTDYVAEGHFGLYQRIIEGRERRRGVVRLAEKFYPRIAETTQKAVDFSDKYAAHPNPSASDELTQLLSELGEELALRAELEDKLIAELCPAYDGGEDRRVASTSDTEPSGQP